MADPPDNHKRPSPLFYFVGGAVLVGIVAGAFGDAGEIAGSDVLARFAVGLGVAAVIYVLVVALWLAWHGRHFSKIGAGGQTIEAPPIEEETRERDVEVAQFMGATTEAIDAIRQRLDRLERG